MSENVNNAIQMAKEVGLNSAENELMRKIESKIKDEKNAEGNYSELTPDEQELLKALEEKYNSKHVARTAKDAFEKIFKEVKRYVDSLDAHVKCVDEIRTKSDVYSQKYIQDLAIGSGAKFIEIGKNAADEVERALNDIKILLTAQSAQLPLDSSKFDTTVALLNATGENISHETIKQIGEEYKGDIASLRAFKSILETQGVKDVFKELIYDAALEVDKLQIEAAFKVFSGSESLTRLSLESTAPYELSRDINQAKFAAIHFGKSLERLAALANIEIMPWHKEIIPKDTAFEIALRSGAGV